MLKEMFPDLFLIKDPTYFFFLGFVLQSLLMLGPQLRKNIKEFFLVLGGSLFFGFFPHKGELSHNSSYDPFLHWFFFWIAFAFFFPISFRKIVFPVITEVSTAASTLVLLYVYFTASFQLPILSAILIIAAFTNILFLFITDQIAPLAKLLLYIWYLAVNIWLSLYFLNTIFLHFSSMYTLTIAQQIIYGMSVMIFTSRVAAILNLLPSRNHGPDEIYEHALVLVSKFSDKQNGVLHNIAIIVGLAVLLYLQHFYLHLSIPTLIGLVLVGSQIIERRTSVKN